MHSVRINASDKHLKLLPWLCLCFQWLRFQVTKIQNYHQANSPSTEAILIERLLMVNLSIMEIVLTKKSRQLKVLLKVDSDKMLVISLLRLQGKKLNALHGLEISWIM